MIANRKNQLVIVLLTLILILTAAMPVSGAPETVRVWVEYNRGQRQQVHLALQQVDAQFHYQFDQLDAFVVSVPEIALRGLEQNPHVLNIVSDPLREPVGLLPGQVPAALQAAALQAAPSTQVVPYGVDLVQARDLWDANRDGKVDKRGVTGAGITVCIIDTGFFAEHEDFAGVDLVGGFSQTNEDPSQWTFDGYGHGTHVGGTIAAANNTVGVVGVTPGTSSLYIVKYFGDDGLYVRQRHASDLVEAIYLCADNGARIINMSLSGTQANPYEERAFNSLYAAGVLSIGAASNDGLDIYHYPASYDSVISVAALDENMEIADFSQFNDQVELAAPGVNVLSTIPYLASAKLEVNGVTYNGYHMDYAPYGSASGPLADGGRCLESGSWAGAVVLCERGDASFFDKVQNVMAGGGVAAVIYNNVPGDFLGTLGEAGDYILAISLSQENGQYLVANQLGQIGTVTDQVEWNVSGYEAWGGTSMATPHVAGVAALLWSWDPSLSNVAIREAMANTALDLGDPGRDVHYGYGLVQAYDAWIYLGGSSGPPYGPK